MYLKIVSVDGKDLGCTPINESISPCDGSYGLIEFLNDDLDEASRIEFGLIDLLRDACEPISPTNFDPKVGMKVEFDGFTGEIVGDE